jgi:hypothetical protein
VFWIDPRRQHCIDGQVRSKVAIQIEFGWRRGESIERTKRRKLAAESRKLVEYARGGKLAAVRAKLIEN